MKKLFRTCLASALLLLFYATASSPAATENEALVAKLEDMHRKAEKQIAVNDFSAAIGTYRDILLEEPDDETAYANMGRCYLVRGDYGRAREAFLEALDINPENEAARRGLEKIRDPDAA